MAITAHYTAVTESVMRSPLAILEHSYCSTYDRAIATRSNKTGCVLVDLGGAIVVLLIHAKGTLPAYRAQEVADLYRVLEPHLQSDFGQERVRQVMYDGVSGLAVHS